MFVCRKGLYADLTGVLRDLCSLGRVAMLAIPALATAGKEQWFLYLYPPKNLKSYEILCRVTVELTSAAAAKLVKNISACDQVTVNEFYHDPLSVSTFS